MSEQIQAAKVIQRLDPKSLEAMTREDFEALPWRENWQTELECHSLVLLPSEELHDSGFRIIDAVAVCDDYMIRVSGCSDVIHLDGIGGYGKDWAKKVPSGTTRMVPASGWCIDVLATSGLIRLFNRKKITVGTALSSLEIFATPKDKDGG